MKPVVREDQIILVSDDYDATNIYDIKQRFGVWLLLIIILVAMLLVSLLWPFKQIPNEEIAQEPLSSQGKPTTESTSTEITGAQLEATAIEREKAQEQQAIRDLVKEHSEMSKHSESANKQATKEPPERTTKLLPNPIAEIPEAHEKNTAETTDDKKKLNNDKVVTKNTAPETKAITETPPSNKLEPTRTSSKPEPKTTEPNKTVSVDPPQTHTENTTKTVDYDDQQDRQAEAPKTHPQNYEILEQSLGISLIQE